MESPVGTGVVPAPLVGAPLFLYKIVLEIINYVWEFIMITFIQILVKYYAYHFKDVLSASHR